MKIEQIYTGCLAQGAYYIVSENEAAIIDPLRETAPYLDRLEKEGVKLKYIFETHFHADFVSGHLDLSKKTGAPIIFGPTAEAGFEIVNAQDEQIFNLGKIQLKVLHTPGHTLESICILVIDEEGKEVALFSGDTLFLGDVGRPDLAQKATHLSQEELAGILYESLQRKILPLPDEMLVYPAHGAGSACGKNMQKETVDTLGNQKKTNYALRQPNKESFVKEVLDELPAPPSYFGQNVAMNKEGYTNFETIKNRGLNAINIQDFENIAEATHALLLDTRSDSDFSKGFIPNAINIGLKGSFAPWVGAMIKDVKQPLLLITDQGAEEETITRLARVGFDNVIGYLDGGFDAWKDSGKETDSVHRLSPEQFAETYNDKIKIIDVRKPGEYKTSHIINAVNLPLDDINDWAGNLGNEPFFIHCAGGYRSMIASGILNSRGIRNFTDIEGGYNKIKETKIPKTETTCQN